MDHVPWVWRFVYGRRLGLLAWLVRRQEAHAQLTTWHLEGLYDS